MKNAQIKLSDKETIMRERRITLRVSDKLMALLENRAIRERRTKSEVIRDILKSMLDH